jgi:ribonucrease Y
MPLKVVAALLVLSGLVGIGVGYILRFLLSAAKKGSMELKIKQLMLEAREQADKIILEAEKKSADVLQEVRQDTKEREEKIKKAEERLIKKDDLLDKRQQDIDKEVEHIKEKIAEVKGIKDKAEALLQERQQKLQAVAGITAEEARNELYALTEREFEEDLMVRIKKLEAFGLEKLENKAKEILTTVIQRLGNSVSGDVMATSVSIPNDEVKGKIIGKEGRNIKTFERVTGVEIIVDDTPGTIMISSFNPVRRQVARMALESLIADGRIQPAKIEEAVEKAKTDINKTIKEKGEAAVYECGVFNLDPRVVSILGRLYFRTSYGQNVLQHSIEVSLLAGMLAEELGANVNVARAGALLHDIGKALDHEVQGTHVEIGRRILQKFGVSEDVVKAMQAHHGEYPFETIESVIVQVADAISGGRPGARRDSVENYIKRLEDLEAISSSFPGVEKSYAIAAGREVRVFVTPTQVSDVEAREMARNIAVRIENELKYPGEIKVTVIREARVIEFAR